MQYNVPYKSKGKFRVAIDNILCTNINNSNFSVLQKFQARLYILNFVEAHFTAFFWLQ